MKCDFTFFSTLYDNVSLNVNYSDGYAADTFLYKRNFILMNLK